MPNVPLISTLALVGLVVPMPMVPDSNVVVCMLGSPSQILLPTPATPGCPIAMLLLPVVRFLPASIPSAMLVLPVVLPKSARGPLAVLLLPVVLL